MKIAIVTSFINGTGGVETFSRLLKTIFVDEGHSVKIIGRELLTKRFWNKWKIKRHGLENVLGDLFEKINRKEKFDLVICNGEYGLNVNHPKAIVVFHGSYLGYFNAIKNFIPYESYLKGLELANIQIKVAKDKYVVTVSDFNKRVLSEQGIKVDAVVPHAVDTGTFKPMPGIENDGNALFVSRYDYYAKGMDILEKLAERGVKQRWITDGAAEHRNVVTGMFVDHQRLPGFYNRAACLLFPSRFEGGGLVTLEAMACGCPVVTSPVGYGQDIRKEIPAFVVEIEDIDEYIKRIENVLENRQYYGRKARKYVEANFSLRKFKSSWFNLVKELVG